MYCKDISSDYLVLVLLIIANGTQKALVRRYSLKKKKIGASNYYNYPTFAPYEFSSVGRDLLSSNVKSPSNE